MWYDPMAMEDACEMPCSLNTRIIVWYDQHEYVVAVFWQKAAYGHDDRLKRAHDRREFPAL